MEVDIKNCKRKCLSFLETQEIGEGVVYELTLECHHVIRRKASLIIPRVGMRYVCDTCAGRTAPVKMGGRAIGGTYSMTSRDDSIKAIATVEECRVLRGDEWETMYTMELECGHLLLMGSDKISRPSAGKRIMCSQCEEEILNDRRRRIRRNVETSSDGVSSGA